MSTQIQIEKARTLILRRIRMYGEDRDTYDADCRALENDKVVQNLIDEGYVGCAIDEIDDAFYGKTPQVQRPEPETIDDVLKN